MLNGNRQRGFSLAEVLMALAILAVGMAFIAGVFPAGIYYTIISTERTIASVVADEAFAKIRLYGVDVNTTLIPIPPKILLPVQGCADFSLVSSEPIASLIPPDEFAYPSNPNVSDKRYYWSALCRRVSGTKPGNSLVQVTVFVSRKAGVNAKYYKMDGVNIAESVDWPVPVRIEVTGQIGIKELLINNKDYKSLITVGSTIVEDSGGRIYRVQDRDSANLQLIYLDRAWQGGNTVWVIPPPIGGGRQPCIGVFQKEILF